MQDLRIDHFLQGQRGQSFIFNMGTCQKSTTDPDGRILWNPVGVRFRMMGNPACASRRWALEFNAFGVKIRLWHFARSRSRSRSRFFVRRGQPLFSQAGDGDLPMVWGDAVLPKVEALPGSQEQPALYDRYGFGRSREGHLYMTGHIVGTFIGMGEMGIVIRHQSIQEIFQIPPGGRIRIFHQNQAATGVAAEGGDLAGLQAGHPQGLPDIVCNFVSALARRSQGKGLLVDLHAAQSRAENHAAQLKKGGLPREPNGRRMRRPYSFFILQVVDFSITITITIKITMIFPSSFFLLSPLCPLRSLW